jgi:hypothetical protein
MFFVSSFSFSLNWQPSQLSHHDSYIYQTQILTFYETMDGPRGHALHNPPPPPPPPPPPHDSYIYQTQTQISTFYETMDGPRGHALQHPTPKPSKICLKIYKFRKLFYVINRNLRYLGNKMPSLFDVVRGHQSVSLISISVAQESIMVPLMRTTQRHYTMMVPLIGRAQRHYTMIVPLIGN